MKIGREFIVLHAEPSSVLGASPRLERKSYIILGVFRVFPGSSTQVLEVKTILNYARVTIAAPR